MADLKSDLQSYLSTSSKSLSQSSGSLSSGAKSTMNSMTSWFSGSKDGHRDGDVEASGNLLTGGTPKESKDGGDTNGWFTQAEKDPFCPSLSRQQRIIGFMGCLAAGVFCFVLAWTFAPLIVVKPRKFALLYTLGSVFSVGSFSLLWGPMNHLKHLCSAQRFPFTATYFGTMFATLYFSMIKQVTLMTIVCALLQMLALVWYVMSYIPGGQTGLKFFTKVFTSIAGKAVSSTLPVWSSKGSKQETPLYKTEEATNLSPLCWWFVKSCDPWGVWVEWFVNFNRNVKVVGSSANMALTCMARHFIHCITPSKA